MGAVTGTTTLPDTITNIKSIVDGFYEGGRNCADSLRQYISSFDGATRDNTILFITGHSLGAATANVVGRLSRESAKDESNFDLCHTYMSFILSELSDVEIDKYLGY